jgi:hypothetical protein
MHSLPRWPGPRPQPRVRGDSRHAAGRSHVLMQVCLTCIGLGENDSRSRVGMNARSCRHQAFAMSRVAGLRGYVHVGVRHAEGSDAGHESILSRDARCVSSAIWNTAYRMLQAAVERDGSEARRAYRP